MYPSSLLSFCTHFKALTCEKKLGHAYLFYGQHRSFPEWVAHKLAIDYFCILDQDRWCHQTEKRIKSGSFSDLHFLFFEQTIKISDVKQIQELVRYGPTEYTQKIVVISNCSYFTKEAANAFLKTLEEPLKGVTFFLCTSLLYDVEKTIQSRCQLFFCPDIPFEQLHDCSKSFPEDPTDAESFILSRLQTLDLSEHNYPSFDAFLSQDLFSRFALAEKMTKEPHLIVHVFYGWLNDLSTNLSDKSSQFYFDSLVNTLKSFDYNVNKRLQLESLFLSLYDNCKVSQKK